MRQRETNQPRIRSGSAVRSVLRNACGSRIASQIVDERHLPHALAILFACGGTPSIYAGDEQAFRGVKEHRIGGDDAIRPVFPSTPAGLGPYSCCGTKSI
jgi:glycosidase